MKYLLPVVFLPLFCQAQGVSAPWDIAPAIGTLAMQAERLKPLLDQLTPEQWEAKGAPAAYGAQLKSAQDELSYVLRAADAFGKQPEKLTLGLETYFRLQALEAQINSLVEGVRR